VPVLARSGHKRDERAALVWAQAEPR
jgi:hypothetical protein